MAISQASPETTYPQPNAQPRPATRLLDLDAAGANFDEPAPFSLIEFIHDQSQEGPITVWSKVLAEDSGPTRIWTWLTEGEARWRDRAFAIMLAPVVKPEGEGVEALSPPKPAAAASTAERTTTRNTTSTAPKE